VLQRLDLRGVSGDLRTRLPRPAAQVEPPIDEVRALLAELRTARVPITETHDEPGYVSLKCLDPDGYEIEVYCE